MFRVGRRLALTMIVPMAAGAIFAGSTADASAGCTMPGSETSRQAIEAFLRAPDALLQRHPFGGSGLVSEVATLAGSDSAATKSVLALIARANARQKSSIGAGLGLATWTCADLAPEIAQQIQAAVASTGDEDVIVSFAIITGRRPTSDVDGAVHGSLDEVTRSAPVAVAPLSRDPVEAAPPWAATAAAGSSGRTPHA